MVGKKFRARIPIYFSAYTFTHHLPIRIIQLLILAILIKTHAYNLIIIFALNRACTQVSILVSRYDLLLKNWT